MTYCEELTDQEWIRLLKQNDQRAVDCLWQSVFRFGIASARYYRVDKDIGREAAVAAYMRIQKRGIYQYHFGCPFVSYCRLIVTNEVRRELEKRNRVPKEVELDEIVERSVGESDPPPRAKHVMVRKRLQLCLDRLSSRKRKVIDLLYFKRQEPEEVAQQLGLSSNYANVLAYRARNDLRKCLEEQGFGTYEDVLSL